MHRLATILHVIYDRQTDDDRRHTIPIARPLVWSAKKEKFDACNLADV